MVATKKKDRKITGWQESPRTGDGWASSKEKLETVATKN